MCKKCYEKAVQEKRLAKNDARDKKRIEYEEYIHSAEWQEVRLKAFEHYGRKCMECGSEGILHVHHNNYKNFKHERIKDLRILCEECHVKVHDIIKERQQLRLIKKEKKKKAKQAIVIEKKVSNKKAKNNKISLHKSQDIKICRACTFNNEGFCSKFNRWATSARKDCISEPLVKSKQQSKPAKTMKEICDTINQAAQEKRRQIRNELIRS